MKNISFLIILSATLLFAGCSESFLDRTPKGILVEDQLFTPDNADKMVIAAYAAQGNERYFLHPLSPWPYGDLRGGDAYKGGAGIGDLPEWHIAETFVNMTTDEGGVAGKWAVEYNTISRANMALQILAQVSGDDMPKKDERIAEMRFLRANNYFWLKVNFRKIPFIDETLQPEDHLAVNNDLPDEEIWGKIIDDLRFAVEHLPPVQADGVGRPSQYAAKAYLAKVLLFAAYEQDEQNQVIAINRQKLEEVVTLTRDVIQNSGKELFPDFSGNFLCESQNGIESLWAIQFSHDDGTPKGRINGTTQVTYPMVEEYGCCGYHSPSQNLVNAFRTVNGIPDFDNYNVIDIKDSKDVATHTTDPRLLHTVAIDGLPYKYKADFIMDGKTWTRQPESYGEFLSLKEVVIYDSPCYQPVNPWKDSSKNRDVIRLADVMLWLAEALIQLDRHDEALPLINDIRMRAAESTGKLVDVNGDPTGNFNVSPYITAGPDKNCDWTREFAFKALQWERRLEFACEGFRAYDLLRWGVMAETMNEYFEVERTRRQHLASARFTKGRDEYLPIPKTQIDLSKGLYQQNSGY